MNSEIQKWIHGAMALKKRIENAGSNTKRRSELEKEVDALQSSYEMIHEVRTTKNEKEAIDSAMKSVMRTMYPEKEILGGRRKMKKTRKAKKSGKRTRKH